MASLPARILASPTARAALRRATSGDRPALAPAAVRVERSRDRTGGGGQTAITVWFGEGPALPGVPPSRSPWRMLAGLGATLAGAAALAAATTVVADREERRRLALAAPVEALPASPEPTEAARPGAGAATPTAP
jgi:hypothetical protein